MAMNSDDCRRSAAECARFAQTLPDEKDRESFTLMAKQWLALAAQGETNEALLSALGVSVPKAE
jgi:hypothetical protein